MNKEDILTYIDWGEDEYEVWHYFRGCPEIKVKLRPVNDKDVIVEHEQKDSRDNWSHGKYGPTVDTFTSTLYDMILAGVKDAIVGTPHSGCESIYITELPKSSQDFVLNTLNLKDYVKWDE
jgi:hypothetical protein